MSGAAVRSLADNRVSAAIIERAARGMQTHFAGLREDAGGAGGERRRKAWCFVISLMPSCAADLLTATSARRASATAQRCIFLGYRGAPRFLVARSRVTSARNSSAVILMRASVHAPTHHVRTSFSEDARFNQDGSSNVPAGMLRMPGTASNVSNPEVHQVGRFKT
jgi:hypothetical protein